MQNFDIFMGGTSIHVDWFSKNFFLKILEKFFFCVFLCFLCMVIFEIVWPNFWGVSTFFYIFYVLRKRIKNYGDANIS